jgi:hypothetical protein
LGFAPNNEGDSAQKESKDHKKNSEATNSFNTPAIMAKHKKQFCDCASLLTVVSIATRLQIPAHKLGGPGYESSITTFSHIVISMESQVTLFQMQNSASFPYIFHTSSIFNSAIS